MVYLYLYTLWLRWRRCTSNGNTEHTILTNHCLPNNWQCRDTSPSRQSVGLLTWNLTRSVFLKTFIDSLLLWIGVTLSTRFTKRSKRSLLTPSSYFCTNLHSTVFLHKRGKINSARAACAPFGLIDENNKSGGGMSCYRGPMLFVKKPSSFVLDACVRYAETRPPDRRDVHFHTAILFNQAIAIAQFGGQVIVEIRGYIAICAIN